MIRRWLPLFAVLILAGASAWKSRAEVIESRASAHDELSSRIRDRERADRLEASWNPGHLVPRTEDVFSGVPDDAVRPTPVDPDLAASAPSRTSLSDLEARWRSDPADFLWRTRSASGEDGCAFADRAGRDFTDMLRVFPARR